MSEKKMEKPFEKISIELRNEMKKKIKTTIIENFQKEEVEEDFYKYEVQLQSIKFVTYMSNEELEKSIELTIDIMEELKIINNSGVNEQLLKEKLANIESQNEDVLLRQFELWNEIFGERIEEIIRKIDVIRRVGGAYAMLISNPCFKSAIYAIYKKLVDNFDNEELYCFGTYFLVRAVMRMHSDEM